MWSESDIQSPTPVSFSVSVPGDPTEMLPSYLDNLEAFDMKMETLGHFQSLMPFEDSVILDMVKNGDVDVGQLLQLPARSPVPEAEDTEQVSFVQSINSTEFQTPAPSNSGSSLPKSTDVSFTPPPPDTPFVNRRKALLSLSDSPVPDVAKKPSKKRAKKRERTPSPQVFPIPVLRIGKNRQNGEWMMQL